MPAHPPGGVRLATATGTSLAQEQPLTHRRDWWWVFPVFTFLVYAGFVVYATFRVIEPTIALWQTTAGFEFVAGHEGFASVKAYNDHYYVADNGDYHYLSPMGTPDLTFLVPGFLHNIVFVGSIVRSPAFIILPFPALFRFTCYYYRKSYYRAFVARPYACAVPAAKGYDYKGERGLLVLQNLHRYFLYAAIVITIFLAYDALRALFTPHGVYFGFGVALMLVNVALLMLYTFGCHSFRHLAGGNLDMFSCDPLAKWRYGFWSRVTMLNERHALWAWLSLLSVWGTDVYIRWLIANPGVTRLFGVIPV